AQKTGTSLFRDRELHDKEWTVSVGKAPRGNRHLAQVESSDSHFVGEPPADTKESRAAVEHWACFVWNGYLCRNTDPKSCREGFPLLWGFALCVESGTFVGAGFVHAPPEREQCKQGGPEHQQWAGSSARRDTRKQP